MLLQQHLHARLQLSAHFCKPLLQRVHRELFHRPRAAEEGLELRVQRLHLRQRHRHRVLWPLCADCHEHGALLDAEYAHEHRRCHWRTARRTRALRAARVSAVRPLVPAALLLCARVCQGGRGTAGDGPLGVLWLCTGAELCCSRRGGPQDEVLLQRRVALRPLVRPFSGHCPRLKNGGGAACAPASSVVTALEAEDVHGGAPGVLQLLPSPLSEPHTVRWLWGRSELQGSPARLPLPSLRLCLDCRRRRNVPCALLRWEEDRQRAPHHLPLGRRPPRACRRLAQLIGTAHQHIVLGQELWSYCKAHKAVVGIFLVLDEVLQ
mmetsp:Transcript_3876/g.13697  ORF Transcript_3876/g.13697 Transcript_3876/m.13697 type:complete len:322 (-) Transcript_3876:308-1273(-)